MTEKNVLQMVSSVLLAPYKPASSMLWLSGDVKELAHISQSVGNEVPDVAVCPLLLHRALGWKMREILVTIKPLYNPRVNEVFTHSHSQHSGNNTQFHNLLFSCG